MTKRGQNEGSIYKREDGRWTAEIFLGFEEGRRKRKWLYGRTRQEVARKLTAALQAQANGLPPSDDRQTLGQFLTRWLTESAKPTLRPTTYESYESYVRLHLIPVLGRIKLARLTPANVQHYLNARLAAGARPRTVQYERAILRRALGQAMKWGLVARNVATLVDSPRVVRAEVPALAPADAQRLLIAVRDHPLGSLVTLALATGMRQGELLGLRWEDIDLTEGILHVRVQMQRIEGRLQHTEPKTTKSRRTIALPQVAIDALRAQRTRQIEDRLLAGTRWQETGLIFTSGLGTPLDGSNITHRFQAMLANAGFPKMRFHDLRHGAASLLLAQGVAPRVVMETLGHSQISLTMNTYSHVIPELQREAAERMDAVLGVPR